MSYLDLFQRYGNPSREADIRLSGWLLRPDALTAEKIAGYDQSAARLITEAQTLIDQLTEYRAALAERYAALATAAYRDRLELIRERRWRDSPVLYHVQIIRTYEDGTAETVLHEHFTGKERRAAFARFAELKHQRPGIETYQDTEKRSWER